MKKLLFIIAIVGFFTASCSKEVLESNDELAQKGTYTYVINASIESDITKTAYAGDKTFSWSKGDQISVLFHNGDDNKFFTLTAIKGGSASAQFKGEITDGYTIGSSIEANTRWALYPAGTHTYNSATDLPSMALPSECDYTITHTSANIAMYAKGDDNGNYSFTHLEGAYKFTFTDVDASKVKLIVENLNSRPISGTIPVMVSGDVIYLNYTGSGAVGNRTLSIIEQVKSKEVSFVIPYQAWRADFMPKLTLVNMDEGENNGFIIKQYSAKASIDKETTTSKMVVFPSASAPGTGVPFISSFDIDWTANAIQSVSGSTYKSGDTDYSGIKCLKVTSTATHLFLYFEVKRSVLYDEDYDYANRLEVRVGDSSSSNSLNGWPWTGSYTKSFDVWLLRHNIPNLISYGFSPSICAENSSANSVQTGDICYFEMKIPRSYDSCIQGTSANIGITLNKKYSNNGTSYGSYDSIGFVPVQSGPLFTFTMVAYGS